MWITRRGLVCYFSAFVQFVMEDSGIDSGDHNGDLASKTTVSIFFDKWVQLNVDSDSDIELVSVWEGILFSLYSFDGKCKSTQLMIWDKFSKYADFNVILIWWT